MEQKGRKIGSGRPPGLPKSVRDASGAPPNDDGIVENGEKRRRKTGMVSGPFPDFLFMTFGMEKGGEIIKNPEEIRSGDENGDFSRNVLFCRRQHENRCSGTSKR